MTASTDFDDVEMGDAASVAFVLEPPRHVELAAKPLLAGKYLIGSGQDCQIRLRIDGVQPHHALLIVGARKSLLKAWNEKTWINDWPVKESVVRAGDRITIGPVTLRFQQASPDQIAAPPRLKVLSPRKTDNESLWQPLLPSEPIAEPAKPLPPAEPPVITPPVAPAKTDADAALLAREKRRLAELTKQLESRAESFERELEQQAREWERRDADWVRECRRIEAEFAAREQQLRTRRQELDARESRLTSGESDLQSREMAWESSIAEIRAAWERTQRAGEQKLAQRLQAIEADKARVQLELAEIEQRRQEIEQQQCDLQERSHAIDARESTQRRALDAEAARLERDRQAHAADKANLQTEFAALEQRRQEIKQLQRELQERQNAVDARELDQRSALEAEAARLARDRQSLEIDKARFQSEFAALEQRRQEVDQRQLALEAKSNAVTADVDARDVAQRREIEAEFAKLESERRTLAEQQTALAQARAALDQQRGELLSRLAEVETQQNLFDELQNGLRAEQDDLLAAQREIQADRAAIEEARAALAAEREQRLSSKTAAHDDAPTDDADRAAFQQAQADFEARQRAWQEEIEQQRLLAAALDNSLSDRQQALSDATARLEEERRELELRYADLKAAEEKLHATIAAQEAEFANARSSREEADRQAEKLQVERDELAAARLELDTERDSWRHESAALRQELDAQGQLLNEAEAKLAARELEPQPHAMLIVDDDRPTESNDSQAEIARLTAELEREQEFRRTVESQLEGLRMRHERDAEQWNSERTDWMVERDRLERELQSSARHARQPVTKPACIDLPVIEDESRIEPESSYVAERREEFVEESRQAPSSHTVEDDDDPLSHVRAELAKMFDLSENELAAPAVATEPEIEPPPPPAAPEPPPAVAEHSEWESRLAALRRQAETENSAPPPPAPAPADPPAQQSEAPVAAEEDDSIAAYMQQMLARNRRAGTEPEESPPPRSTISMTPRSPSLSLPSESLAEPAAPPAEVESGGPPGRRSAKPRLVPSKDTVREHLDVFRAVANVSARRAVAKHSSRRMWMLIGAKGIVALVCSVACAAFLYVSTTQQRSYEWQALGCGVLALGVGLDLLRHLFRSRRPASRRPSRSDGRAEVASAELEVAGVDDLATGDDQPG